MLNKKYNIPKQLKNDVWTFVNENEMGQRFEFNGTKEQQFIGLVGEIMVKSLFGINHEWTKGFDGGFDFQYKGFKIDVKTMGRNVDIKPDYVNNFVEHQIKFDCDIYIFCSLNRRKNELTICGYISKKELLNLATLVKKGSTRYRKDGSTFKSRTAMFEIKNTDLKNIEKLFYYLPEYLK